jgi:alpha-tubulin suppressor-like RCC1 family protein
MPGGSGGSGGTSGTGPGGEGGEGAVGPIPDCVTEDDCTVPETAPEGCAEAACVMGSCVFSARDGDNDQFPAKRCLAVDPDIDIIAGDDCDDGDPTVNPDGWDGPAGDGHAEGCNDGIDQDCSGTIDDDVLPNSATCTCTPADVEPCGTDSNGVPIDFPLLDTNGQPVGLCRFGSRECDTNGEWGPCVGAIGPVPESCDNLNNDCDTQTDEAAVDASRFYCDGDSDGRLASTSYQLDCQPTGNCSGTWREFPDNDPPTVFNDCDDDDSNNYPGNVEACDGQDNNCDDIVDGTSNDDDLKTRYYRDQDGDTFGTSSNSRLECQNPGSGWVTNSTDCNDGSVSINPNATEICNGTDDDCDSLTDAQDGSLSGMPTAMGTTFACSGGEWHVTGCPANVLDCDDDAGNACETDATAMTSCRACDVSCSFDCGATGCNEVTRLAAGLSHGCAATQDGLAYCWGGGGNGRLGDGATTNRDNPTQVSNLSSVSNIAAGLAHTCAIAGTSNALSCWGSDADGQLGSSAVNTESSVPLTLSGMTNVVSVALGDAHSCAVLSSGLVRCWGRNTSGQVGDGSDSTSDVVVPATVLDTGDNNLATGVQVATGSDHSCALLSNNTVSCWGNNGSLQLGNAGGNTWRATAVAGLSGVSQIAAGSQHTCALASGRVYCWGSNDNKQVGQAGAGPFSTPQEVPSLTNAIAVACGFETTCVIRSGGAVECWGGNTNGQRGDAPGAASATRVVVGITSATRLVAGIGNFTCALRSNNAAYCWGNNGSFQLGKTGTSTHVPQLLVE